MNKKKIFKRLKIFVIGYCLVGILLYYLQEFFLFHPTKLAADYKFSFDMPFEEVNIPLNDETNINLIKFFTTDSVKKGVVLYFHGNKQNINRYARFVTTFTKHGYDVWMPDYPTFGKSTGKRDEKTLNELGVQVYKMANAKFKNDSIIIYGKSLGTGIASYVASNNACKRLILETPYYSVPSLFSSYAFIYPTTQMSTYKIPQNKYVEQTTCPVTIFHGTSDGVVFYSNAKKLKTVLKPTDEFITIEKGTHHNLAEFELYQHKLDSLLNLF